MSFDCLSLRKVAPKLNLAMPAIVLLAASYAHCQFTVRIFLRQLFAQVYSGSLHCPLDRAHYYRRTERSNSPLLEPSSAPASIWTRFSSLSAAEKTDISDRVRATGSNERKTICRIRHQ